MKTTLDCYPCFLEQANRTTRLLNADQSLQKEVLNELCRLLPQFDAENSPPEMGEILYSMIAEKSGIDDPFKEIKEKSNRFALDLFPHLKEIISKSEDHLFAAVKLAILGNIIDYGAVSAKTVETEIQAFLDGNHREEFNSDLDFDEFKDHLRDSQTILYLADNAGEIVFDRLLIEELLVLDKKVTLAVRGKPAINDVLMADAKMVGLTNIMPVISNGSGIPGTVLKRCSEAFRTVYHQADMIISKGQGNYETLSNEKQLDKIFFMFKVKCPVVAKDIDEPVGTMILKKLNPSNRILRNRKACE